jgi:hypothetical protein
MAWPLRLFATLSGATGEFLRLGRRKLGAIGPF